MKEGISFVLKTIVKVLVVIFVSAVIVCIWTTQEFNWDTELVLNYMNGTKLANICFRQILVDRVGLFCIVLAHLICTVLDLDNSK